VHGAPLGADETALAREALGWQHKEFEVPKEVYDFYHEVCCLNLVLIQEVLAAQKSSRCHRRCTAFRVVCSPGLLHLNAFIWGICLQVYYIWGHCLQVYYIYTRSFKGIACRQHVLLLTRMQSQALFSPVVCVQHFCPMHFFFVYS